MHLHLVEARGELIEFGSKASRLIVNRLKKEMVTVHLGRFVIRVDANFVYLKVVDGKRERIPCQFLVWTGGVQVNPIVAQSVGSASARGAIPVDATLQSSAYPEIFAAGDNAALINPRTGKLYPMLAQFAFLEGKLVAENIAHLVRKRALRKHHFHPPIIVIPMGGRYGIMKVGRWILKGKRVWLLHRLVSLRYAIGIVPFWKALRKWRRDTKVFVGND